MDSRNKHTSLPPQMVAAAANQQNQGERPNSVSTTAPAVGSSKPSMGGVGTVFRHNDKGHHISQIVSGSPADECGLLQVGDICTHVNGTPIDNYSLVDVRELIVGPSGSRVNLRFVRSQGDIVKEIKVELVRRAVAPKPKPQPGSIEEMKEEIKRLKEIAAQETRKRAHEETMYNQVVAETQAARAEHAKVEKSIQMVLAEMQGYSQQREALARELHDAILDFNDTKDQLDEQLYDADNKRIAAELQVRKTMRDGCFGPLFA